MENQLLKVLQSELKQASEMLGKYESKLLDKVEDAGDKKYFQERVTYWSSVRHQILGELLKSGKPA